MVSRFKLGNEQTAQAEGPGHLCRARAATRAPATLSPIRIKGRLKSADPYAALAASHAGKTNGNGEWTAF